MGHYKKKSLRRKRNKLKRRMTKKYRGGMDPDPLVNEDSQMSSLSSSSTNVSEANRGAELILMGVEDIISSSSSQDNMSGSPASSQDATHSTLESVASIQTKEGFNALLNVTSDITKKITNMKTLGVVIEYIKTKSNKVTENLKKTLSDNLIGQALAIGSFTTSLDRDHFTSGAIGLSALAAYSPSPSRIVLVTGTFITALTGALALLCNPNTTETITNTRESVQRFRTIMSNNIDELKKLYDELFNTSNYELVNKKTKDVIRQRIEKVTQDGIHQLNAIDTETCDKTEITSIQENIIKKIRELESPEKLIQEANAKVLATRDPGIPPPPQPALPEGTGVQTTNQDNEPSRIRPRDNDASTPPALTKRPRTGKEGGGKKRTTRKKSTNSRKKRKTRRRAKRVRFAKHK